MKEKLKQILHNMQKYNCNNMASDVFGLNATTVYDTLVGRDEKTHAKYRQMRAEAIPDLIYKITKEA